MVDSIIQNTSSPKMLTVHDVARMLNCSTRTVYRLTDSGRMPRPVKLGALIRWPCAIIEQWITNGCPRPDNHG
jgi:excisionase family DNA binding protein